MWIAYCVLRAGLRNTEYATRITVRYLTNYLND